METSCTKINKARYDFEAKLRYNVHFIENTLLIKRKQWERTHTVLQLICIVAGCSHTRDSELSSTTRLTARCK